jgi:hypothetical protein
MLLVRIAQRLRQRFFCLTLRQERARASARCAGQSCEGNRVEGAVNGAAIDSFLLFNVEQVPMGRSKTSVLQLAGFYMYPELFPALCFCHGLSMYSGELQQALRVLALCGKGRGGATASEACVSLPIVKL